MKNVIFTLHLRKIINKYVFRRSGNQNINILLSFFISLENEPKLDQNKCLLEAVDTEKHDAQEVRNVMIKYIIYYMFSNSIEST